MFSDLPHDMIREMSLFLDEASFFQLLRTSLDTCEALYSERYVWKNRHVPYKFFAQHSYICSHTQDPIYEDRNIVSLSIDCFNSSGLFIPVWASLKHVRLYNLSGTNTFEFPDKLSTLYMYSKYGARIVILEGKYIGKLYLQKCGLTNILIIDKVWSILDSVTSLTVVDYDRRADHGISIVYTIRRGNDGYMYCQVSEDKKINRPAQMGIPTYPYMKNCPKLPRYKMIKGILVHDTYEYNEDIRDLFIMAEENTIFI